MLNSFELPTDTNDHSPRMQINCHWDCNHYGNRRKTFERRTPIHTPDLLSRSVEYHSRIVLVRGTAPRAHPCPENRTSGPSPRTSRIRADAPLEQACEYLRSIPHTAFSRVPRRALRGIPAVFRVCGARRERICRSRADPTSARDVCFFLSSMMRSVSRKDFHHRSGSRIVKMTWAWGYACFNSAANKIPGTSATTCVNWEGVR